MARFRNLVIIPCYNEEATIIQVVKESQEYFRDVLVIDDCSSDTSYIRCEENKIHVIRNLTNLGYERTLIKGIEYAQNNGFTHVTTIDADGEIEPKNLLLIKQFIGKDIDVFIGIRKTKNRIVEKIAAKLFQAAFGVQDPFCGFKCYNLKKNIDFSLIESTAAIQPAVNLFRNSGVQAIIEVKKRNDKSRYGSGFKTEIRLLWTIWKAITKLS